MIYFKDREEAGELLADKLKDIKNKNTVVLGLARGGVPVAAEVAKKLGLDMDVMVVRKIGDPSNPEFALGAIAPSGIYFLDKMTIERLGIKHAEIEKVIKKELLEVGRRLREYRHGRKEIELKNKNAILVDDGIATGATFKAAIRYLRRIGVKSIIAATPVCPSSELEDIKSLVDKLICLKKIKNFSAVGAHYKNFEQLDDQAVKKYLN